MSQTPDQFDPLVDTLPSRYVVGIDLGTTNSAVSYVDTTEDPWCVRVFSVPQLVAPGEVETRETLPSFHYEAAAGELAEGALRLPWQKNDDPKTAVGFFARDEGTRAPGRLIASAKSWLCHTGVNRSADLLPWQGAADVERLSPVEVSARLLGHVRDAWNHKFPGERLEDQDLVITIPASFDEVARELTVEAARRAELPRVTLIEEPQAAFYAWVYKHAEDWHKRVEAGQTILVCDIGGGTSDFTLIRVRPSEGEDGQDVQFHRVAVGDHLILGGDNLDLALANHVEHKLTDGGKLQPNQWDVLVRSCRRVKETMLGESPPDQLTVNLPGSGSKLIGGSLQVEVTRDEVIQLLRDGFLPNSTLEDMPQGRQSGIQEFGLPYASDYAITRYLAQFLSIHRDAVESDSAVRPDIVVFNGGFFASPLLRARLIDVLKNWFAAQDPNYDPIVLDNERLDLAVAIGAGYYGMVRRGEGVRIAANLARTYYVGVEADEPSAICLVPGSAEPGQDFELADRSFALAISQPVEFPLFVSSTRLIDQPGDLLPIDEEQMKSLPAIRTVLKTQRRNERGDITVRLHARLTEIGTIELWCADAEQDRRWRLQFDVRAATQTDLEAHTGDAEQAGFVEESQWNECRDLLYAVFDSGTEKPDVIVKKLANVLDGNRTEWPPSLLRRIWETLMEVESGRKKSPTHEARWLNLLGYSLRPGYGIAVDDWRVTETWRTLHGKFAHFTPTIANEALILWRRIAGGLSTEQQKAVAEQNIARIRRLAQHFQKQGRRRNQNIPTPQESVEVWRLLGSLELLPVRQKIDIAKMACELMWKPKLEPAQPAMIWALGRLGQRAPLYGPLNTIVPQNKVTQWLDDLMSHETKHGVQHLAIMQIARRTDDRHRDLPEDIRDRCGNWLEQRSADEHLIELVRNGGQLETNEQNQVVGESLPRGLRLV